VKTKGGLMGKIITVLAVLLLTVMVTAAQEFEGTWKASVKGKTTGTHDVYGVVFKVNEYDMITLKYTGEQENVSMYVGEKGVFARVYNGTKDTVILEYSACNDALTYQCAMAGKNNKYKGYGIAFGFVEHLTYNNDTGIWSKKWDWAEFPIKCKLTR
jgi:hypothetical protein